MKYWGIEKSTSGIEHYGVKGMKWRKRKKRQISVPTEPYDPSNRDVDRLMNYWENSDRNNRMFGRTTVDRVSKKVRMVGKRLRTQWTRIYKSLTAQPVSKVRSPKNNRTNDFIASTMTNYKHGTRANTPKRSDTNSKTTAKTKRNKK